MYSPHVLISDRSLSSIVGLLALVGVTGRGVLTAIGECSYNISCLVQLGLYFGLSLYRIMSTSHLTLPTFPPSLPTNLPSHPLTHPPTLPTYQPAFPLTLLAYQPTYPLTHPTYLPSHSPYLPTLSLTLPTYPLTLPTYLLPACLPACLLTYLSTY